MPELPEAEVIARQLKDRVVGATLKGWWLGRPDIVRVGLETLEWYKDATVTAVERLGKSVVLSFSKGEEPRHLVAELGMTGLLFFQLPDARYATHTHLTLWLEGGLEPALRYWNPRRFGRLHLLDDAGLKQFAARRFGWDPLTITWPSFRHLIAGRRGRLKALLMHQQVVAGIGNIYANEILHRARVHPYRRADRLRTPTVRRLYDAVRAVLTEAIGHGGSSIRDFLAPDGSKGMYTRYHLVYGRAGERCQSGCGRTIRRLKGERSSFYCPACQPP